MPKAELYKISVADGKVMLRIPEQLVGAETADMDDIQAELHMMDVDYVLVNLELLVVGICVHQEQLVIIVNV